MWTPHWLHWYCVFGLGIQGQTSSDLIVCLLNDHRADDFGQLLNRYARQFNWEQHPQVATNGNKMIVLSSDRKTWLHNNSTLWMHDGTRMTRQGNSKFQLCWGNEEKVPYKLMCLEIVQYLAHQ